MGWNSWNKFACSVNEKLIREVADALVASGIKEAGYTYINIDDCWHGDGDIKKMTKETTGILTKKEVIEINQDSHGI